MTGTSTLTTLVGFNGANGDEPTDLIADSNGDLFGTTVAGGANGDGTVFEIVKTAGAYASTPTTLVSFNGANGDLPRGGVIADLDGDLFGTTELGGTTNFGTVFEIVKTPAGYASTPTTLVNFGADGIDPEAGLIADFNGDLFGTTDAAIGTAFEIAKTADGYASTPTTLVSFDDGSFEIETLVSSLIADSNGDLFGTTDIGGANGGGAVFEIAKTAGGYASTPTILVSFNGTNGDGPLGGLIADSNGDLFGTTDSGGASGDGTVFEIAKTAGGYTSTPTTLFSFNGGSGSPEGDLIMDANGDLFGATFEGGAENDGTVFEIAKTAGGYASTPTTLVSFNHADGDGPSVSLIADSNGDLFGTTDNGGASNFFGTVFEIASSDDLLWQNTSGQASIWDMNGNALVGGGPVSVNPGPSWNAIGMGDFDGGGVDDILLQNTTSGQASIWQMNGNSLIGGGPVSPNPGPNWRAVGVGDFDGDGLSDILWQNISTGQASIWEIKRNALTGGGPVSPNPGPAWKAIGAGDFTNDGHSDDILWQNTSTGQVSIWEMDGDKLIGGGLVTPNPGPSWKAIGTGDFNHDGFSDILFQNASTGQLSIWEMSGNKLTGGGPVSPNPGPSWHAIGTDGGSDILFQNTSGQASIWDMNGTSLVGGGPVSPSPGPGWRAVDLT